MTLEDGCYSLKLECALRELGFVDVGWKCVAHAGLYFVQPFGIPSRPCLLYTSPSPRDS